MQVTHLNSKEISFYPKLIEDYIAQKPFFTPLVQAFPSLENLDAAIKQKDFPLAKRKLLASTLKKQYQQAKIEEPKSLNLLAKENTFTITTGHQLCMLTGPLYFIYKIISTIKLSTQLQERNPDLSIVPVFWMASEDHDFQEVNHLHLFNEKYVWNTDQKGPVGRFPLDGLQELLSGIESKFNDAKYAVELSQIIQKAYHKSNTLSQATRILVHELFSAYNLVVIDGDDKELKASFMGCMIKEIKERVSEKCLIKNEAVFKKNGYKTQISPRPTGLFYLNESSRSRIDASGDDFKIVGTNKKFTTAQMIADIKSSPEKYSPNVSLRPVYQEFLLPNIAVIGGPGETSYWLQLKSVFDAFQVNFPILVLRDSFLMIHPSIQKKINKYQLSFQDIFSSEGKLVKQALGLLGSQVNVDLQEQKVKALFGEIKKQVVARDGSLNGFMEAEIKKVSNQFQGIQKKLLQSSKRENEVLVSQISSIKNKLFPQGSFQERYDNFIPYYLKDGKGFIDRLVKNANPLLTGVKVFS